MGPHHGRHRQVGQSRNRLAQRQEGNACCHRKHPEDGLDSRSVGHFAERVRRKNLDSSRKTRNNSTGTEHALKTGTIAQQSNNNQPTKEPTFPRTRRKKQHIDEKQKTDNISRRRTAPFLSISTTTRCRNERKKKQQTLGLVASSFPFLFLCPDPLSFHVSKNNNQEYRK